MVERGIRSNDRSGSPVISWSLPLAETLQYDEDEGNDAGNGAHRRLVVDEGFQRQGDARLLHVEEPGGRGRGGRRHWLRPPTNLQKKKGFRTIESVL